MQRIQDGEKFHTDVDVADGAEVPEGARLQATAGGSIVHDQHPPSPVSGKAPELLVSPAAALTLVDHPAAAVRHALSAQVPRSCSQVPVLRSQEPSFPGTRAAPAAESPAGWRQAAF